MIFPSDHLYALSYNNGQIAGTVHWIAGAGRPADVQRFLVDERFNEVRGGPQRLAPVRHGARRVDVYRWRPPRGGFQAGHVTAFTTVGAVTLFASVHGFHHADAVVAMVLAMSDQAEGRSPAPAPPPAASSGTG